MERILAYLELLSQEQEYLDRLLGLACQKREAILTGAADRIVEIANSEDSTIDTILDIRKRRRSEISWLENSAGTGRGRLRQRLLAASPPDLRPSLLESMSRYESKLLQLRRQAKINNTLLSDRILLLHHTLEKVVSSVKPKEEYSAARPKNFRRKEGSSTPSMLVDQKV